MRIIRRIARLFMLPLLKNGVFFVTMYILGILCAYLTLPDNGKAEVYDNLWLELFLDLYVACVILAVIPRKVRLWVRRCLYVILYGVAITDVFCFWKFGSVITPSMLMLVGETDSREAGEFFSTYLSPDVLTSPVMWIILLILAHIVIDAVQHFLKFKVYHGDDKPLRDFHSRLNLHWLNIVVEEAEYQFVTVLGVNETRAMVKFEFRCNPRLVHHHHRQSLGDYGLDSRWDCNVRPRSHFQVAINEFNSLRRSTWKWISGILYHHVSESLVPRLCVWNKEVDASVSRMSLARSLYLSDSSECQLTKHRILNSTSSNLI